MTDLIKREDAINHCEIWRDRAKDHKDRDGWWMADNLLRLVKDIPIAEPKRGEWIDYTCGSGCYCSNCGWDGDDIIDECIIQDFDFCPNCGADMKGADDESD